MSISTSLFTLANVTPQTRRKITLEGSVFLKKLKAVEECYCS